MEVCHADQGAVTIGCRRVQHIVGRQRAVDAVLDEKIGIGHAAAHIVILVASHQIEIVAGKTVTAIPTSARRRARIVTWCGGIVDSFAMWPTTTRPPRWYCSVSSQTKPMFIASGVLPTSR